MPDEPKKNSKVLAVVVVVVLLCAGVAGWLVLKSRQQKTANQPPTAALRLDLLDQTNRVATVSDDGSRDPDGTLQSWRIAWGDGKVDNLSALPKSATHTYAAEGDYTISLWCVDNQGATNSLPATARITFDLEKRQQALAQSAAQREADRLKEEQARQEAERLAQEKQREQAAEEARKLREQQELEEKQKAQAAAELARQKEREASKIATALPPIPLAAAMADNDSTKKVIFTPSGFTLGEFQITKEKTEATQRDGTVPVILSIRCVNFPDTPIVISHWQFDGKEIQLPSGRIRASLSPGQHEVIALLKGEAGTKLTELKADVTVQTNGECIVKPKK